MRYIFILSVFFFLPFVVLKLYTLKTNHQNNQFDWCIFLNRISYFPGNGRRRFSESLGREAAEKEAYFIIPANIISLFANFVCLNFIILFAGFFFIFICCLVLARRVSRPDLGPLQMGGLRDCPTLGGGTKHQSQNGVSFRSFYVLCWHSKLFFLFVCIIGNWALWISILGPTFSFFSWRNPITSEAEPKRTSKRSQSCSAARKPAKPSSFVRGQR